MHQRLLLAHRRAGSGATGSPSLLQRTTGTGRGGAGTSQAATLEQIAGRASLTRGALYHHFADRADLDDAVLREQADQVMRPLLARLAGGGAPLQRLHEFLAAYAEALAGDARFRAVLDLLLFRGGILPQRSQDQTLLGYRAWLGAVEAVRKEAHTSGELLDEVTPAG